MVVTHQLGNRRELIDADKYQFGIDGVLLVNAPLIIAEGALGTRELRVGKSDLADVVQQPGHKNILQIGALQPHALRDGPRQRCHTA